MSSDIALRRRRSDELFDVFWLNFPRKVGRLAAKREWDKIRPDESLLNKMLVTLAWQREQWDDPNFIPHPRTWLHQGRWDDEPCEIRKPVMSDAAASVFRVIGGKAS